jgi:hypothetical protein
MMTPKRGGASCPVFFCLFPFNLSLFATLGSQKQEVSLWALVKVPGNDYFGGLFNPT